MGYTKVIRYSNRVEVFQFEKDVRLTPRKKRILDPLPTSQGILPDGKDDKVEQRKIRKKENTRRAVLAFNRLVSSNLGSTDVPILITLTYAKIEHAQDVSISRKDFNIFARSLRDTFNDQIRYICVSEFQKRGAIHFHALFWGLPESLVREERHTRRIAKIWGRGFVDLVQTDGNIKIAGYLSKYLAKSFEDQRLDNKKAYITSRNLKRPIFDRNTIIEPYYYGYNGTNLSTALSLKDKTFMTKWLGKCRYRLFELIETDERSN